MASASSCASSKKSESKGWSGANWEYDGEEIFCYCGVKCPMWTTWKNTENIGRRFFSCPNYRTKKCGFFRWIDEPMSERARFVIYELKKKNEELKKSKKTNEDGEMEEIKLKMIEMQRQVSMAIETVDLHRREKHRVLKWMILAWMICFWMIVKSYV
ncbi:hypothetical protein V6N13_047026 [Hibiscus sabdariffa]|uniref:GRF-type domain-containing protein n=1 Tax=Hibiscus sabdariffa TaxID=183260 RepID=A0ABR2CA95_9ROSI